jgi:16S rRNA (uracil1498-N3)-methyltransferase
MKIFLEKSIDPAETVVVRDEFWDHYVTTVRRCRPGDELDVVGHEKVGTGRLEGTDPLTVQIESVQPAKRPSYRLFVCQAISRKQKYDDLVRRGSDVGITDFIPIVTEHTVRVPNKPEKQRDRWRRMALESARVSDRDWVSTVHPIVEWPDVFDVLPDDIDVFWGDPEGESPRDCYEESGSEAAFFVGPEGGFNQYEKQRLRATGSAVSLGSDNYRAETASLMLSTMWLFQRNHFSSGEQHDS